MDQRREREKEVKRFHRMEGASKPKKWERKKRQLAHWKKNAKMERE